MTTIYVSSNDCDRVKGLEGRYYKSFKMGVFRFSVPVSPFMCKKISHYVEFDLLDGWVLVPDVGYPLIDISTRSLFAFLVCANVNKKKFPRILMVKILNYLQYH